MKKAIVFFITILAVNVNAQRIVDKEVGNFNEVKVFDLVEVNLIKSDENRILIKGENVDDIKFVNKNGVLKLRMELEKKFTGEDTFIEVYYTQLDIIDANEGAQITCNALMEQDYIELRAQEGARIKAGLNVDNVDMRAVTGGILEVSGLAKRQNIVLNTGGIFEGRDLKSAVSSVKITAAGEAEVHASDKIDIKVKAGGDVYVYGNPKEVNKRTFAGGRIYMKD
ncbi:head GIN domain-containing protein [Costertonia aggregata]|uniref:DUF2807 domain-containing protein n=1 Tax=Costertonia aggregata TaxID=343403 RepID=A0A7H9ALW5_9FLAO|nr:head GIN domain-containing protein [Costertonia aggregata]QLG44431.1 DUF2807 domain-containing protein [Costertonia aggregata]